MINKSKDENIIKLGEKQDAEWYKNYELCIEKVIQTLEELPFTDLSCIALALSDIQIRCIKVHNMNYGKDITTTQAAELLVQTINELKGIETDEKVDNS